MTDYMAQRPSLYIATAGPLNYLYNRSLNFTENLNKSGTGTIVLDHAASVVAAGDEMFVNCQSKVLDKIFAGRIRENNLIFQTPTIYEQELLLQDYSYFITDVTDGIDYDGSGQTEHDILDYLFANYCTDITFTDANILGDTEGETIGDIYWDNAGLFECVNELAALNNRIWWVGSDKAFHYIDYLSPETPELEYSDNPDLANTFPYSALQVATDIDGKKYGSLSTHYGIIHPGQALLITNSVLSWDGETEDAGKFLTTQVQTRMIGDRPIFTITFGSPWLYVEL